MSELTLFVPGRSVLHRAPSGAKLIMLAVVEVIIAVTVTTPVAGLIGLALLGVGLIMARLPGIAVWRRFRTILLLGALVAAGHVLVGLGAPPAWSRGVSAGAQLITAVGVAVLVTATTRLDDLLETVRRGLGPFRRLGLDPDRTAVLLVLAIRSVGVVAGLYAEIRDAHRARGLGFAPTALGVPLVVRSLRHADRLGDALRARGFDD